MTNTITQEEERIPCQGIFFAIGHTPASAFLGGQLLTDEQVSYFHLSFSNLIYSSYSAFEGVYHHQARLHGHQY